jgi:Domain of unknown function (DUF1986)
MSSDSSLFIFALIRTLKSTFKPSRSAKSAKTVEFINNHVKPVTEPEGKIDIRRSSRREKVQADEKCTALEVECVAFQSHSFSIQPIQTEKLKKNSTIPAVIRPEVIFVPVNEKDQTHMIVKPQNKTKNPTATELKNLFDIDWPWAAEIFMNGEFAAHGVLLDKSWVLAEAGCLGGSEEPLRENHVTVLFGNSKARMNVQSPHEHISRVDCLNIVDASNVILLHLETPVDYNRHILPALLPTK